MKSTIEGKESSFVDKIKAELARMLENWVLWVLLAAAIGGLLRGAIHR